MQTSTTLDSFVRESAVAPLIGGLYIIRKVPLVYKVLRNRVKSNPCISKIFSLLYNFKKVDSHYEKIFW